MSEERNHPDFDAAPAHHRWVRSLSDLKHELRAAAFRKRGEWAWYVLPHGAVVSMRVDVEHFPRRELRIARRDAPKDDAGRAAWQREIKVFLTYFDAESWTVKQAREQSERAGLGIDVVLVEPIDIPAANSGPVCADCGKPALEGPQPIKRCTLCAIKAGQIEAARLGHVR